MSDKGKKEKQSKKRKAGEKEGSNKPKTKKAKKEPADEWKRIGIEKSKAPDEMKLAVAYVENAKELLKTHKAALNALVKANKAVTADPKVHEAINKLVKDSKKKKEKK